MNQYIVSLDQGTSSCRAVLFNEQAHIVDITQREFAQHFPQPGWVEHDAVEIWECQLGVLQELLAKHGLSGVDIAAIGITNQRETTVLWDKKTGKPIHNAIVWQDRRSSDQCKSLRDLGHEALVNQKTGLLLDP